jgi:hypothetical protein
MDGEQRIQKLITAGLTISLPTLRSVAALIIGGALFCGTHTLAQENRNGFDYADALVPPKEILWGGVPRNGIPAINTPTFVEAAAADFLSGTDRVLGVSRNGVTKAYPIRIMDRHEIVNDRFGDEPIVVTYCPLCFSGMAFKATIGGEVLSFGVSGLLYNSDVLLYDYQTDTLWSQIMSKAISGPLKGTDIEAVAVAHTTWRDWEARFPETQVLTVNAMLDFRYTSDPYARYQSTDRLMFPVARKNRAYKNKEHVLGLTIDGVHKAYPFRELRATGKSRIEDVVAGRTVTIEWHESEDYARVLDADGDELPSVIVYWFAWYAFHPLTVVFPG